MISNFVSLTGSRRLGIDWILGGQLAFSDQTSISGVSGGNNGLAYRSYSGSLMLNYQLAQTATASLAYSYFLNEGSSGQTDSSFTRQIVSISIAMAFY